MNLSPNRRNFLRGACTATMLLAASPMLNFAAASTALPIPNSNTARRPNLKVPAGACDSHIHIIDPSFPPALATTAPLSGMSVDDYRLLQRNNGTSRVVVVQTKYYGTDNRCTVDAVKRLGPQARGIAVVHPSITDDELQALADSGIRGLRFSVWNPKDTVTTPDMILPLAERIGQFGMHVQLHMSGDQIVEHQAMLKKVKVPMVFDHMGRLPPAQGPSHPAFNIIRSFLDSDRAWVKLAGAYLNTLSDGPDYPDASAIAKAFIAAAPQRLVWGSDWPHITEQHKPDDAVLMELLGQWTGSEAVIQQVLVSNPAKLYGF